MLLGPTIGTLLGLLLALFQKRKILITNPATLLTSGSEANSKLLMYKVILEPIPTGHMLYSHDASYKTLPRFGKSI
jgi:hypothetical protein